MTTRTYYFPRSCISVYILNRIVTNCGCSIGELKVNRQADTIRVAITCNDIDVTKIERILKIYGLLGD